MTIIAANEYCNIRQIDSTISTLPGLITVEVELPSEVAQYAIPMAQILGACVKKLIKNKHKDAPASMHDVQKLRRLLAGEVLELDNQMAEDKLDPNMVLELADCANFLFLIQYAIDGETCDK